MKQEVQEAVAELRRSFGEATVVALPRGDGGAVVTIDSVDVGPGYVPQHTWVKFLIGFQYPQADIYPLFVHPELARADGLVHGKGITLAEFEGEPALQLSRRSNHLDVDIDTAVLKVAKVIQWLRER